MPKVSLKHKNESFEGLMRRFKNVVEESEILKTLRKYEYYESNGEKKKRAKAAAIKREQRRLQEENWLRNGIRPPKPKKKVWRRDNSVEQFEG